MRRGVARDPYWTTAVFPSKCAKCGAGIKKGARIFYYPNGGGAYCDLDACGQQESRNFAAALFDERGC